MVACDSSGGEVEQPPPAPYAASPLLGGWEVTGTFFDVAVVSRVDQVVPNLYAPPEGGISVRGALEADLQYFAGYINNGCRRGLEVREDESDPAYSNTTFVIYSESGECSQVHSGQLSAYLDQNASGLNYYRSEASETLGFAEEGGRLTIPALFLQNAADPMADSVRVEGGLTFPTVLLGAGEEVRVPQGGLDDRFEPYGLEVVFFPNGQLLASLPEGTEQAGTWRPEGPGQVTIPSPDSLLGIGPAYTYEVDGDVLSLWSPMAGVVTDTEALTRLERSILAEEASLVQSRTYLRLQLERISGVDQRRSELGWRGAEGPVTSR